MRRRLSNVLHYAHEKWGTIHRALHYVHHKWKKLHKAIATHQRYVITALLCVNMALAFCMRQNFDTWLKQMDKPHMIEGKSDACPKAVNATYDSLVWGKIRDWRPKELNLISMAFYTGYLLAHLPGGIVADIFGGKHFLMLSILLSGVISLLLPEVIVRAPWQGAAIINFSQGVIQAICMTAKYSLLAQWVPKYQLVFLVCVVKAGRVFGHILSVSTTILLVRYHIHWKNIFYIWGVVALIIYYIDYRFIHSRPSTHTFLTPRERLLIENDLGTIPPKVIPWWDIFSDSAVWSLMVGELANTWLLVVIAKILNMYMRYIIGFNKDRIALTFVICYSSMMVSTVIYGWSADRIITHTSIPTMYFRGIFTAIGNFVSCLVLLWLPFVGCDEVTVVTILALSTFIKGAFYSGVTANLLDITRNFAGTTCGLENGIGSLISIATSNIAAILCAENTQEQWRKLMWLSIGLCALTTILVFSWGKGRRAQWDKIQTDVEVPKTPAEDEMKT